ncbi:MAG: glycosyltransferase family 4 protein [Thermoprotei archaeon]|jgi:glycosyltransferase involved in cell wall biosynthesis
MRIAFFVWEFYPRLVGGLGTYAIEITRKYIEMGHDVTIFTLNDGTLKTREVWKGIEIHRPLIVDASKIFPFIVTEDLARWGTYLKFFNDVFIYNILTASKMLNLLIKKESIKYDIIAVHDWLSTVAGLIIKTETPNQKVVFHVHSTEEQRSNDGSSVIKYLEHTMAQNADKIITVSYAMRDHLATIGYPVEKIRVVWNGVDPTKYDPTKVKQEDINNLKTKYGIADDEKTILFIGRLTWVKGVQNLIQALPLVLHEYPKTKLIIIGKGEQYQDLINLTERLNIKDKVIFISKWLTEEERILHYALADLCTFPSLSEPFGIVSLEAMAMEKPVIVGARGISGFREQVVASGPEQCGIHINGEDPADIAWGIKETLKDENRAKQWGKNGRKRVQQLFTWDHVAKSTLTIYQETLQI